MRRDQVAHDPLDLRELRLDLGVARRRLLPVGALRDRHLRQWFEEDAERGESSYDLVCAELCGWGHYKMAGSVRVMRRDLYEAWLAEAEARGIVTDEDVFERVS